MELNLNDDELHESPDADLVCKLIVSLEPDEFAVLGRADEQYIQVYHNDDGIFQLEYRAGSAAEHYAVVDTSISVDEVAEAFRAYMSEVPGWQSKWEWEPVRF